MHADLLARLILQGSLVMGCIKVPFLRFASVDPGDTKTQSIWDEEETIGHNMSAIGYNISPNQHNTSANGYNMSANGHNMSAIGHNISANQHNTSANGHNLSMFTVVMMRHGESTCNRDGIFCGWYDADLTHLGEQQVQDAGRALRAANVSFDVVFTSVLKRAFLSSMLVLKELGQPKTPLSRSWNLNERFYGGLTSLNKRATVIKHGAEQVHIWRRSYEVPPPPIQADHPFYNRTLRLFRESVGPNLPFPTSESLKDVVERSVPFWRHTIVPHVKKGSRVLIVAHGSVLRSLVKHIEDLSAKDIRDVNIPNAIPFIYTLDEQFKLMKPKQFLADANQLEIALDKTKNIPK